MSEKDTGDTQIDFNMLLVAFASGFEALRMVVGNDGKLEEKDLEEIKKFVAAVHMDDKLTKCLNMGIGIIKGDE